MTKKSGLYLYAIVPASVNCSELYGINGASISFIANETVAAAVSTVTGEKIRPQRKHLAHHQQVLKSLMAITTPLPIKFGMIAADEDSVKNLLKHHYSSLAEQLESLNNTVEMGLRLNWNVPNIFEYIVDTHPELKAMREQASIAGATASRDNMIEIGYRFSQVLENERQRHTQTVETALADCCVDIKVNDLHKENEVMNLACLVTKDSMAAFEKTIYDIANLFNDDFALDYNGPWAPHNFVDLRIEDYDANG